MKYSLKELRGYNIITMDGSETKIRDILFDEETWIIRYIEADFGHLFASKKVLVPRMVFKDINPKTRILFTDITSNEISKCPKPEDDEPVSRKYEEELNKYYGTEIYWSYTYPYIGTGTGPAEISSPRAVRTIKVNEENLGTSLHSFNEVSGYAIHAIDGKIGHVDDFIAYDKYWHIEYIIVDTGNWLPWSKKVVFPINQIKDISYENKEAKINLTTDIIRDAPEYDHTRFLEGNYENTVQEFYNKNLVSHR